MAKKDIILSLLIMFGTAASVQAGMYSGGTGEPNDPYRIAEANDMQQIGVNEEDWDKHFKLIADINLSEYTGLEFNVIGTSGNPFTGVFDGNGHTISNFTRTGYVGSGPRTPALFRFIDDPNAEIRDLTLLEPNVAIPEPILGIGSLVGELRNGMIFGCGVEGGRVSGGHMGTGGLVGYNYEGVISNCYATCDISEGDWASGGLVGHNEGTILNCHSTGGVSASESWGGTGGLVGQNDGTISNCYATGSAQGDDSIGGLVARNGPTGTISNCYTTANVKGSWGYVGGLAGDNGGTISDSYATGAVDGNEWTGGLSGGNWGTVTACFWDVESSGVWDGAGIGSSNGITGKTTAEMKKENTFTDAGWDFVEVWGIGENQTYPFLRVHSAGDLNHDDKVNWLDLAILAGHWLEGAVP
jgi:hypothetical protein